MGAFKKRIIRIGGVEIGGAPLFVETTMYKFLVHTLHDMLGLHVVGGAVAI